MEKVKADLAETRKNLKNLTKYVIGHLEALLAKVRAAVSAPDQVEPLRRGGRQGSRLQGLQGGLRPRVAATSATRSPARSSSRVHEVRQADPGLQGRPLPGDRAAGEVLRRAGPGLLRPAGARAGLHAGLHQPRGDLPEAVHLRRHDPEQGLSLHPAQIARSCSSSRTRRPSSTSATSRRPTRRSTSRPATRPRWRSKAPKTRGRQISIKDVAAINVKPPRGWDPEATTTKVLFA